MSGPVNYEGVPFEMRTNASGNNVIWATSNGVNALGLSTYSKTVTLNTNSYGTRSVYTLINTAYSFAGANVGSITFLANDGTSYSVNLVIGNNVRNHYYGIEPSANYVTTNVLGSNLGAHLDMQRFDLPASFATKRLTGIRFTTTGSAVIGIPFLAGVTLDAQADLIAKYTLEEPIAWSGLSGELKDSAGFTGGPFNGRAVGSSVPVRGLLTPARTGAANGTCAYAQLNGPSNNGGAFQINNLPVTTFASTQNSITFWMYWNGTSGVVPAGWNGYNLAIKNNIFGFDADGLVYGVSTNGLANGWHHISAVFTNIDVTSNKLYIDGVLQTLSLSGSQKLVSFFNPDAISTNVTPPNTWGTGAPPDGWFTDNPSRVIEVNPPSVYGATGSTSLNVIEIEGSPGDYNLYTNFTPNAGEKLTLSVDYAGRSGYMSGTDSAIDIYINNALLSRLNTRSAAFRNFTFPLGFATGSPIKLEFRSVDKNSYGGLITNIQIFRNRAVASSSLVVGGTSVDNSSRFTGNIDEVKVYNGAVTQAQVNADYAETHQCLLLHHARLNHSGNGLTCAPTQVTVQGCIGDDSNGTCSSSFVSFAGTVVAQSNGVTVATAAFVVPAGSSSALVELDVANPQTLTLDVVNYSIPPYGNPQTTCWDSSTNTASCQYTTSDAGFIISNVANGPSVNIANQEAGVNSSVYVLRAVKKNTTTRACEAALKGSQDINFGYVCNNPTTCSAGNRMKIGIVSQQGAIIESSNFFAANNNASGFASTLPITLNFDDNGNAPFWLNYYDVGQTTLFMQKTLPNGARLAGNSNAFVTKPFSLIVNSNSIFSSVGNIANPAAANAAGPKFIKSGELFKATVTAFAANGDPTANFGKEIIPEAIRLNAYLEAPAGGAEGVLSNNTTASVSFNNGSATIDTLSWSEVGILRLIPVMADDDYMGAGKVVGVGASGNIGRFYPDHFNITAGSNTLGCSNQFTYFGQDGLYTAFTITAKNKTNGTTQNYAGNYAANSFMKFNTSVRDSYRFTTSSAFTLDPSATPASGSWTGGVGSISAKHIVRKPPASAKAAPTNITFFTQPLDDDGVTTTSPVTIAAGSPFRYGRMFLQSQHGSELLNLPMLLEAQYWDGNGYIRNAADSCSTVPLSSIAMKNYHGNLNACETGLSGSASLINGIQTLRLSAPGVTGGIPNTGSVDLEVNLNAAIAGEKVCLPTAEANATSAGMPWLIDGSAEPAGRATFGRSRMPVIYMREAF
ncbi:DUF6701 domain-containing protein [Methylophilus aquaticus]|uniref:DUF6701 domain-containing protein n=1 Tax=Methylophilus aquaticus TaxID=1971610 RepID=A0ABT9JQ05_9PROT|nr:DUF6701 domain-containing protein [Methylophilus aquaticus]MDP8566643.1 hypothetical protein [Methylophilus aquaticus]